MAENKALYFRILMLNSPNVGSPNFLKSKVSWDFIEKLSVQNTYHKERFQFLSEMPLFTEYSGK